MFTLKCVTSLKEWWMELWCFQCLPRHSFLWCALSHCLICITFYYLNCWWRIWVEASSLVLFQCLTTPKACLNSCLGGYPMPLAIHMPLSWLPWSQARAHQQGPKSSLYHSMPDPRPGRCVCDQEAAGPGRSQQSSWAPTLTSPTAQAVGRAAWAGGLLICYTRVMIMREPLYCSKGTTEKETVYRYTR